MSKLNELIAELCPNGVDYLELKDVMIIKNGKDYKGLSDGKYPVYGSGGIMTYVSDYVYDKPSVLIPRKGSIDKLYYVEEPFWNVDTIFYTDIDEAKMIPRYAYFCLQKEHLEQYNTAGGVPSLTQKVLNKIKLPVPPLEVQLEIIHILDNLTELTEELREKLTEEFIARKKQYGYYRNKFLTFDKDVANIVELRSIVKKSCSGATPAKGNSNYYEGGTIPWLRTQDVKFNEIYQVDSYITELAVVETGVKWIPKNCVIVAISGATAGRCAINKFRTTTNQHCLNLEIDANKALYKYIFYCVYSKYNELIAKKQGTRGDLNSSLILGLQIPLPSLEIQNKIVHVLDKFETICSDLNIGLPAEIEARQKQYEFYRDMLLTYAATGKIILTNKQTKLNAIKIIQYVFGYVYLTLDKISENCDHQRKPIAKRKRDAGKYPYYGASGIVDYVSEYIFDGDYLLVSEDGANLLARNTPIAFSISGKNWVNNHAHVLKFDTYELRRYVEIYLNSIDLSKYISGGAQPKLNQENLNKISIPIPSEERVKYVVDILDHFDILCNDLSKGLPAEIEARQKQYEYYRDKLLSFKELSK